jgi:cold shock CspA family protein
MKKSILFTLAVLTITTSAFAETITHTGVVKFYNSWRGFGYIVPDNKRADDIFFHYTDVASEKDLETIDVENEMSVCVSYEKIEASGRFKRKAVNVKVIDCK